MSKRRMFSADIVMSDAFVDMPISAQALYFHLVMRADDDGFIGSPKQVMRMLGASDDDVKILLAKRFILTFESGVVVVKHWLIHNLIRADRYKETTYKREKATLGLNENGAYTELREGVPSLKKIAAPDWLKRRKTKTLTDSGAKTHRKRTENGTPGKVRLGKDIHNNTTYWSLTTDSYGDYKYQRIDHYGYMLLSRVEHPLPGMGDIIKRAKFVLLEAGIEVPKGYHINHINRDRLDDRLDNLEVLTSSEHTKKHWQEEKSGLVEKRVIGTPVNLDGSYGKPEINEMFEYWNKKLGYEVIAKKQSNRNACNNLLKKHGKERLAKLIDGVALAQSDQYAPRISDFSSLQAKLNELMVWGKQKSTSFASKGVKL